MLLKSCIDNFVCLLGLLGTEFELSDVKQVSDQLGLSLTGSFNLVQHNLNSFSEVLPGDSLGVAFSASDQIEELEMGDQGVDVRLRAHHLQVLFNVETLTDLLELLLGFLGHAALANGEDRLNVNGHRGVAILKNVIMCIDLVEEGNVRFRNAAKLSLQSHCLVDLLLKSSAANES